MTDRPPRYESAIPLPAAAPGRPRLHIDTLRIRISGADASAGQRVASELATELTSHASALAGAFGPRSIHLPSLQVRLAGSAAPSARGLGAALQGAIARASSAGARKR